MSFGQHLEGGFGPNGTSRDYLPPPLPPSGRIVIRIRIKIPEGQLPVRDITREPKRKEPPPITFSDDTRMH